MTSDVVLTAALRNNLLSLQNTQSVIDIAQNRLSTGRKVNSALDNPQSFFASQALNNRASDLTRLLDTIGQSIQVIKAADNGVTALTKLVEQADSVAQSARDALAQGQVEAKVTGNRDLRGIDDLVGLPGIQDSDSIILSITNAEGIATNIGSYSTSAGSATATATIRIRTNDSIEDIIAQINSLAFEATAASGIANGEQAFEAKLDAAGKLQIRTLAGNDFRVQFQSITANSDVADLALASDLGFADIAKLVDAGGGATNNNVEFTAVADVALRSFVLYDSTTTPRSIANRSDQLNTLVNSSGTALFAGIDNSGDDYQIGFNGGARVNVDLTQPGTSVVPTTIQGFLDGINNNTTLNSKIVAEFDDATGVLSIRTIDASVKSIEVGPGTSATAITANFGFGRNGTLASSGTNEAIESIYLSSSAGQLAQYEDDFNNLRDQIDQLVSNGDTGYRGTNLLNGDDLLTFFNEDRSSSLETQGQTFTADGLGLEEANFARADTIEDALEDLRTALETVRSFGSSLANDLSIIQTRQTFTTQLINTLKEGSDALTVADQNEEGAKLLALQTRQQLGVTALSLASQSQQSILRLF